MFKSVCGSTDSSNDAASSEFQQGAGGISNRPFSTNFTPPLTIDKDSKLIPLFVVEKRDAYHAKPKLNDGGHEVLQLQPEHDAGFAVHGGGVCLMYPGLVYPILPVVRAS